MSPLAAVNLTETGLYLAPHFNLRHQRVVALKVTLENSLPEFRFR
jgi:hypothetical protein